MQQLTPKPSILLAVVLLGCHQNTLTAAAPLGIVARDGTARLLLPRDGLNSGTYVGIILGILFVVVLVLYSLYTYRRVNSMKRKVAAASGRTRLTANGDNSVSPSSSSAVGMTTITIQPPEPSAQQSRSGNRGFSRLFRNATGRTGGTTRPSSNNNEEDTQRLIAPTRTQRSNSNTPSTSSRRTSFSEVDLGRHPSLASVYRKSVKCLTPRELNSMFPAVEYGELSYNMKLQNIDSSNIYTTYTQNTTHSADGIAPTEEHDTLGFVQPSTSLFEAYPSKFGKPKKVYDSDEEEEEVDEYDAGPYEDPNVCIICQGDLQSDDMVRMLSCHHIFHDECVSPWILEKNGTCPLCKRDLVKEIPARVLVDQDEKIGSKLNNESILDDDDAAPASSSQSGSAEASSSQAGPSRANTTRASTSQSAASQPAAIQASSSQDDSTPVDSTPAASTQADLPQTDSTPADSTAASTSQTISSLLLPSQPEPSSTTTTTT